MSAAVSGMGSMGLLDGLADEEMPNPMFPMSEDLSLDFAALSADLGEDFQEVRSDKGCLPCLHVIGQLLCVYPFV